MLPTWAACVAEFPSTDDYRSDMSAALNTSRPTPAAIPPALPDGLVVVLKRDCETCRMVAPLLSGFAVAVYTQDDPIYFLIAQRYNRSGENDFFIISHLF